MNPLVGCVDHVLFFGRTFPEVLEMLALREDELRGRKVLDCPSGPDAFVAESHRRGYDVTGADPLYHNPVETILEQGRADIREGAELIRESADQYPDWDSEAFIGTKEEALEAFGRDFPAGKKAGRYVAAALPELPFPANCFDFVFSANFLFLYSSGQSGGLSRDAKLDLEFHLRSVRELMRVCRGELRLYPILRIDENRRLHAYAAQIIGHLAAEGVPLSFTETAYNQRQVNGHLVLSIDCTG